MPILSDPQGRRCPKKHFDLVLLYINIFHLYIQYLLYANHSNICNLISKPYNIALKSPIIVTFFKFILFNLIRIPHTLEFLILKSIYHFTAADFFINKAYFPGFISKTYPHYSKSTCFHFYFNHYRIYKELYFTRSIYYRTRQQDQFPRIYLF